MIVSIPMYPRRLELIPTGFMGTTGFGRGSGTSSDMAASGLVSAGPASGGGRNRHVYSKCGTIDLQVSIPNPASVYIKENKGGGSRDKYPLSLPHFYQLLLLPV